MEKKEYFKGAYKTSRGSYKEFNELMALFFSLGNDNYRITKESVVNGFAGDFIVIWKDNKIIHTIET